MADSKDNNTENNEEIAIEDGDTGGKNKLIVIVAAVLLLLLAIGGVLFFILSGSEEDSIAEADSTVPETAMDPTVVEPAIYLRLKPAFVIDFNIGGKPRYIQLDLTLKSRSEEQLESAETHMPLIRNSLVLLFSNQDFNELKLVEGKQQLKMAAKNAVNAILQQETGAEGIEDVLFTNFVMQ